jgi:peroxiredoxin
MEDLKHIFDKVEKAEAILADLDKKRDVKAIEKDDYDKLSHEYHNTLDHARKSMAAIKEKLSGELIAKTAELTEYREELALLDSRLKAGELSQETYDTKSKGLDEKVKALEGKVVEIQTMIDTHFPDGFSVSKEVNVAAEKTGKDEEESPALIANETKQEPALTASTAEATMDEPAQSVTSPVASVIPDEPGVPTEVIQETAVAAAERLAEPPAPAPEDTVSAEQLGVPVEDVHITEAPAPDAHIEPAKQDEVSALSAPAEEMPHPPIEEKIVSDHSGRMGNGKKPVGTSGKPGKFRPFSTIIIIALLIIVIGILAVVLIPRPGYEVGNIAPDFVMQLRDESSSSLSAFRSKNVILVFWDRDFWDSQFFTVNGVERKLYTPDKLNQLYAKYSRNDLEIIAIASGTNNNEVDNVISSYDVKFPVIVDSFGKLRSSYNVSYEPTFIFIDRSGRIRARTEGPAVNLSDLEQAIHNMDKSILVKPTKPPITDVIVQSNTEKSASISWVTDKPATTQVDIDGKNIQTVITQGPVTLHAIALRDLYPNTSYQVRVVYNVNNINVSERSYAALMDTVVSKRYPVTTLSKDTSYPELSSIGISFLTDSSVTVKWKTDEPASGEVDYSTDKNYKGTATQGDTLGVWHTVLVDGLKPETQYFLRIRSKDASGKETVQEIEPVKTTTVTESAARIGKRAPDFKLASLDGGTYSVSQFKGRKILLNFWLEGCAACTAEMPLIQTAFNKYTRDQLIVLAVNVYGDLDKVRIYVGSEKLTFPILLDTEGNVDGIYKSPNFPTTYFIDTTGVIREIKTERFQTVSEIDDTLNKLP